MGKKTKFQSKETSQLAIHAESSKAKQTAISDAKNPQQLELNDDVILEKTNYTENDARLTGNLSPIDQSILLAFCLDVKNTNPNDGLTAEEMLPYVLRVLENPNNWMITTMALLLRSRLEAHKSRTVERSCLQLQTLVDQWNLKENDAPVEERLNHFFSLLIPPKWEMEKELGLRFVSIGVIRSALEIFERLRMWENVISCHQMLEQPKKADTVILELLEKFPGSPKYLCLLGDVRSETKYYEQAWEKSGNRYSRAMRSLGAHYFKTEEWQKSIECYDSALAINPMFENSWFILGCAALRIEDYPTAARAFSRVTQLEPENSEAWNNLASVYIKEKKLEEAFKCLKEAIRVNFEATNIWENYLFVAVDLKEISEAMRAIEKIFNARIEKHEWRDIALDEEILELIVTAVINDVPDSRGQACSIHANKLKKLLENICERYSSATVFRLCGEFHCAIGDWRGWIEYSTKAYRHLLNQPTILESSVVFKALVDSTLRLVEVYHKCKSLKQETRMGGQETPVCPDWIYQSKMCLKAVIGRTKVN